MKINDVLAEMAGPRVYDVNNLPEELQIGDVMASKQTVMGEEMHGEAFKVEMKQYDENLNTYKYTAFSVDRIRPSHDPEEAPEHEDFVFTIQNGKAVPVRGYESVAREHNF